MEWHENAVSYALLILHLLQVNINTNNSSISFMTNRSLRILMYTVK